jgi:hypothetical protein
LNPHDALYWGILASILLKTADAYPCCRMLSAKLTEEEGAIKPFYIDLRDTPTFITEKDIVRQPYLEEIIRALSCSPSCFFNID